MTRQRDPLVGLAVVAAILVTGAVVLAACGSGGSHQSAPDPGGVTGSKSLVLQMPPGFRNVAVSCVGTTGVYVTSRGVNTTPGDLPSGVAVLRDDPYCK